MNKKLFEVVHNRILNSIENDKVNVIGIHGPQGMGKTTINKYLKNEFSKIGLKVIILSIDDFYFEYKVLKQKLDMFNNKLYKFRGLAGTHDLNLLNNTIKNIKNNKNTLIPIFNKNKFNGFGDRDGYYESGNDIDVIIIEGWLIGYEPHDVTSDDLYLFNENLKLYKNLKSKIDFWVKVESNDIKNIYGWRWSAEDKENGMDKETFDKFLEPYMEIYKNYKINDKDKIVIDKDRNVIN